MAEETQNADVEVLSSKAEGMAAIGALSGDAPAEAVPEAPAECELHTSPEGDWEPGPCFTDASPMFHSCFTSVFATIL